MTSRLSAKSTATSKCFRATPVPDPPLLPCVAGAWVFLDRSPFEGFVQPAWHMTLVVYGIVVLGSLWQVSVGIREGWMAVAVNGAVVCMPAGEACVRPTCGAARHTPGECSLWDGYLAFHERMLIGSLE